MTTKEFQEKSDLSIFLSYFKPHKKLFIVDLACALMISLIDLAFPYVSRWCMYELLPQSAYRTFFAVMLVVFFAYVLRSVMHYIICYWGHTFGILVEADIRRDLFLRHVRLAGRHGGLRGHDRVSGILWSCGQSGHLLVSRGRAPGHFAWKAGGKAGYAHYPAGSGRRAYRRYRSRLPVSPGR